jgi:ABC-2 type transport system ATP-binding protein
MAHGTAAEIIAEQRLTTFTVVGGDLAALNHKLLGQPGIDQSAVFGAALHVTGKDGKALEATLRQAAAGGAHQIAPAEVGLEDVFIHLMARSQDNFGVAS